MPELRLHNKSVDTIFQLLGEKENDITYSVGWALYRSPSFLQQFLKDVADWEDSATEAEIRLQHFWKKKGITDIEIILGGRLHLIVEAKCGWHLPA